MNALASLRHLSADECLGLLAQHRLGRVSVSMGALPAILPVKYALWNGEVVFRTAHGSKLSNALIGAVAGFEVDDVTEDHSGGWSVLVVGHATEIRDEGALERARALPLAAWGPGGGDQFVSIPTQHMTGRAFGTMPA